MMLFPPTEREAVLAEVRAAVTEKLAGVCRATREACECINGGMTGTDYGDGCKGCPLHAVPAVTEVLDRLARKPA